MSKSKNHKKFILKILVICCAFQCMLQATPVGAIETWKIPTTPTLEPPLTLEPIPTLSPLPSYEEPLSGCRFGENTGANGGFVCATNNQVCTVLKWDETQTPPGFVQTDKYGRCRNKIIYNGSSTCYCEEGTVEPLSGCSFKENTDGFVCVDDRVCTVLKLEGGQLVPTDELSRCKTVIASDGGSLCTCPQPTVTSSDGCTVIRNQDVAGGFRCNEPGQACLNATTGQPGRCETNNNLCKCQ